MRPSSGRGFVVATVLLAAAPVVPARAQSAPAPASARQAAPDPFYSGLLRDGRTALVRGDAAAAAHDLRLACFGFLDFPAVLAECRMRLGLAQAALGDRDAFLESFSRIEDLEERFQVYSAAAVTPEERAAFEKRAIEWVSPEVLRSIPAFAPILDRQRETDFAKLAPRERTKELERRAAADPREPRWALMLADEELAREKPELALDRLAKFDDATADGAVGCLRGRAAAEAERCDLAVEALRACSASRGDAHLADLLLGCYVRLEQGEEGRAFAAVLAPAVATRPEIRKRIARLPAPKKDAARPREEPGEPKVSGKSGAERGGTSSPKSGSSAAPVAATSPKDETSPTGSRSGAKPTPADRATFAELRKIAESSERRDDLERALARAQPIADRYPKEADLQLLVGELAYRTGKWKTGAEYLARPDSRGPQDPTLRFYLAVCQFESGDAAGAARTASKGLEKLPRTPFVDNYLKKIAPRS